jgi:hypothetical protein
MSKSDRGFWASVTSSSDGCKRAICKGTEGFNDLGTFISHPIRPLAVTSPIGCWRR